VSVPGERLTFGAAGEGREDGRPLDETRVPSRWGVVMRRFLGRRLALAGLVVLALLFVFAFLGPYLTRWSYTDKDYAAFLSGPSTDHWFGTTQTGGDVYALTVRGMQKSLIIGLLVALFSTGLAAVVGAFAGYFGAWVDRSLMWLVELLLVLPGFLVVAILSPLFRGRTWLLFVVLLAAFSWMVTARIVRGMTISLREREYVLAARYMGLSGPRIIFRHILPNISSLLIIDATINVSGAIIAETGLSYFGFGVQPPDVSLGTLIADGTPAAVTFPWLFGFAAGLLVLIVLSVNLVGDGLRDALDPSSGA
jgi:ABC-type dipeptide/oligopeptide/nickel transport system permease subunit